MKNFIFVGLLAAAAGLLPNYSWAQNNAPASPKLLPCKDALAQAAKDNQARANAECQTVYQCVECMDEKNTRTCRALTVQPQKNACLTAAEVVAEPVSATKQTPGGDVPAQAFAVEILQSVCVVSGISLEAIVPQEGISKPDGKSQNGYSFLWEIDGQKNGHAARIECVEGKEAKVTVTKLANGHTVVKRVRLSSNQSTARPDEEPSTLVASFKRTGCFGNCPIYEVRFYSDGTAIWNGQMNVGTIGKIKKKLDPSTLTKIEEQAILSKFFTFKDRYPEYKIWDAPSTVTYLNLGGKQKTVEHVFGGPEGLVKLEQFFEGIIAQQHWLTSVSPNNTKQQTTPSKD